MRAQGAVEYLILLAVVLVMALVVVALLSGGLAGTGDTKITESLTYWRGAAPIGIIQLAAGSGGNKTLIQNNAPEIIAINSITLTNIPANGAVLSNSTGIALSPGQRAVIEFVGTGPICQTGGVVEYNVVIAYNTGSLLGSQLQIGSRPIAARCY